MQTATCVPVWLVIAGDSRPSIGDGWDEQLYPRMKQFRPPLFRGVPVTRLGAVLTTGVDVDPTDAPIYCSDFDKAWEYGGTSMGEGLRLVYALDPRKVDRTFRTLPLSATASEIAEDLSIPAP